MIKTIAASILVGCSAMALGQGVIVEPGKGYVFEFTSIPYVKPALSGQNEVIAWFAPGTLSLDESPQLEVFANSLSDVPLVTQITIDEFSSGRAGVAIFWGDGPPFLSGFAGSSASNNAQRQR